MKIVMRRLTWSRATIVLSAFCGLAALQAWPLPRHLDTHLTGSPAGDTGAYVWNLWVFRHELVDHGRWPLFTDSVFAGDRTANLARHNFTLASNILALPLQSVFDLVTTFNLVMFLNLALGGFGVYLLARRLTRSEPEAIIAGGFFLASGFMVGRATAHFSLIAAAPLPLFVWALLRCWERRRLQDAALLGVMAAWALISDPYYAVYCLLLGAGFLASRAVKVWRVPVGRPLAARLLSLGAALALTIIVGRLITGGGVLTAGPIRLSIQSFYTPVLVFTILLVARALLTVRVAATWAAWPARDTALRLVIATGAVAMVAAAPILSAQAGGEWESPSIFWRTGPQGADLLAFVMPHWNHPWLPGGVRHALAQHPGGLIEQSASLSPAWFLILGVAGLAAGWRPPRRWLAALVFFGLMALGPFIFIANLNTHVPTPWAVLRYVPLIGEARMPSRMAVLVTLMAAVLLASALAALSARWPRRRPVVLIGCVLLLMASLWPMPARLESAAVPRIYDRIAKDPRDISVLVLPTGVRDGLRSVGNFNAEYQFQQTFHGKRLVGGYLSRTARSRRVAHREHPVLGPLIAIIDHKPLLPDAMVRAQAAADGFILDAGLAYVVIDHARASPELERFAVKALGLTRVERDASHSLYVTQLK